MSKVDWSLAPEGATHYSAGNSSRSTYPAWWRPSLEASNKYECWAIGTSFGCEKWQRGPFNLPSIAVKREWSGPEDGLPPVGVECEVDHGNGKHWDKVTILAHHGEKAIYLDPIRGFHYIWGLLKDFRTIRTEEQLAAEQRETAIADMAKVLPGAKNECYTFNDDGSVRPYAHIHDVLGLLVDAGFKREVV